MLNLQYMHEANPREISFASSWREIRVIEGSSYRGSTIPLN